MAKPWQDVVADTRFQALDDAQKENARQQYFNEVVQPKVPEDQVEAVRLQFDKETKPSAPESQYTSMALGGAPLQEKAESDPQKTSLALGGADINEEPRTTGEMLDKTIATPKAFGAAAAKATLGISESIFRTPDAIARHYDALVQSGRDLGLPEWALPKTEELYVPDAINLRKHANIVAGEISKSQQLMVENFDTFKMLADKGKKADEAFKAAIGGDTSHLTDVLTDVEAWAGFIGNAAPTLYASLKSGGSPLFIAWMEAMDTASDAADFEAKTGKKIDDREFARTQLMVAGINTWLEKLGVDKITNAKGLLGIVGSALTEGTTEGLQELVQNIAKKLAWRPKQDLTEGILPSIMGGAGTGASASSAYQAATALHNYSAKAENKGKIDALKKAFETLQSDIENEIDTKQSVSDLKDILRDKKIFSEAVVAFDEYEADQTNQKKADEEKAFAEIQKTTVVPADLEPAAPTTAGQIKQSLEAEKAERAISAKPKSVMEAAFEAAKPEKKYGLPIEEAATQVDTAPTEAQKEAGNYKKGHTQVQGMDVAIENPKGSIRSGVDEGGQKWSQKMGAHYGYIKRTQGADGDHVDVFLGPDAETADTFYVVNQNNPTTGKFDEHKVMIGYPDEKAAKAAYMANYDKKWAGFDSIVPLSTEQFKRFVHSPKAKKALPDSAAILLSRQQKPPTKKKGFVAVSPNDWDAQMSFDEAATSIRSEKHQTSHAITDDIFDEMGLEHTTSDALGDWIDGAEDSLLIEVESPKSMDQLKYAASLTGKFFNQKGALSFIADENGVDSFYKIKIPLEKGNIEAVRSTLDELKLDFRTLIPGPTGTTVVIYDEGTTLSKSVSKLGKKYEQDIEAYKGQGELIGSWDSRQEGISAYNREIGVWERKNKLRYSPTRKGLRDFWGTGYQEQETGQKAPGRTLTSPIPLSRLNAKPIPDVYGKFGVLDAKKDTTKNLKFYNLDKLVTNPKLVRDLVKRFGFEVKYFSFHVDKEAGVEFVIPKLKKQGYKDGYLWIYDPRVAHGSFKDAEYTRQWRIVHELGHAITEDFMQKRYGDSRREGRLGQSWMATRGHPDKKQAQVELEPLTLKEAQRAVEWEDVAFRVQRMLFAEMGITVDPAGFAHEYNTNVADASYRVLTGDFGDLGEYGFVPRGTLPSVKSVLKMFENTENAIAREQGRKPTKGINLDTYKRIHESELRAAIKVGKDPLTVLASRGAAKGGKGLSVAYIEKTAVVVQKNWKNAPEMEVVAVKEELPAHIRESLITTDSYEQVIGMYVPSEGRVYLVADKINSKAELFKVIMHEVMGHHGLRGLFGDEINPFLEEVYRDNKEKIRDLAKTWGVQITPKNRLELTEELIAVTAETNPKSTIVTRTLAKIAQWLRNIMPSVRLTNSELVEVIVGMRQAVQTGEVPQIAADTVQQIQNDLKTTNESDPSAMRSVAKFVRRHFTKEGLLNDEGFEAKIKSDSLKKAGEEDVSFVIHKFEEAMNKEFGTKNYVSISEEQLLKVNNYLHGEKVAGLSTEMKETLDGMRAYLDRLSGGMQKAMVDMMVIQRAKLSQADNEAFESFLKGEPDGYVPASIRSHFEMHQTISKNMGTYMNRSYEAFDNAKWKNKALKNKDLIKRAEAYIAERNPDLIPEEVHGAVRAILQAAKDKGNFFSFISGGTKYGTKDVSMLTNRKDVPDVIRELLGEYLDPRINFVRSATKMYNYLANHEFLMQLRSRGLGIFMFERPIGKFDKRIAAKGAETMNPIDGLYTTEDFIQGLEDMRDAIEGGAVMRSFIRLNSAVKYGKTILAPTTQARNFMSAAMFSVMNGHFDWSHGQKAFRAAQSDLFTKDTKWRKYLNNLISLGVLHDNPRAEELRHALEDFMNIDIYSKGPTKSLRRFLNFMQRLYQVGDDFWKIIGFENEIKLQMETGKSRKDAEIKAAYRIRNGYPTYSMVPRAVKMVRRWPLIGTFVSFPYEIVRTTANQMKFLKEDVAAGNTKMVAQRTLGMAMATSISATLSYMSMVMMGLESDDDEAVRSLAAPWVRNSQLIYLGYDESGYPKYIDFSYFDPYTYLKKPITAILNKNNEGIDKKVLDALVEFLEPFIGVDIAAGALMEIYSNKRAGTGTKIYNPEAPTDEIALDMINHFRKAAQPGVVSNAERMTKAIRGETSPSGKEYKIEDEAVALVGFRMGTLNVPQSIYYKTLEFKDVKSLATQQLNKVVGSGSTVTEKDIKRGFSGMIRARKKGFTEMIKMVNAAEKLGVKKSVISRVLKAAKVNKSDIRYIMNGRIPRWRMTSQFMDAAQTRALATANKEGRPKIRKDFYKRKKYVYELMNEQKVD